MPATPEDGTPAGMSMDPRSIRVVALQVGPGVVKWG